MKTIHTLLMISSMSALVSLQAPAEDGAATAKAAETASASAEATPAAAPQAEAMQVARDHVQLWMEICDIIVSDKPDADKIAAIKALHPRAFELGERGRPIVGDNEMVELGTPIDKALDSILTQEHINHIDAARKAAEGKRELVAACEEINDIVFRGWLRDTKPKATKPTKMKKATVEEDAPQAKPEAHELMADDVIHLMMDICAIIETDKPTAEKIAALQALKPRATRLGTHIRSMGTKLVGETAKTRMKPEQRQRIKAAGERMADEPKLLAVHQELVGALATGAEEASDPKAKQAAQDLLSLMQEMEALLLTDRPEADKLAALEALRPRVVEMSKRVQAVGFPKIIRAAQLIIREQGLEPSFEGLDKAFDSRELGNLLEELMNIMRGMPPSIAIDAPAEQVAADFIATLKDGLARLKQPGISEQELLDIVESMLPRFLLFNEWSQRSRRGPQVDAILKANAEFHELGKAHQFLHNYSDKGERVREAASRYMMFIDMVISSFGQRFEAPRKEGERGHP